MKKGIALISLVISIIVLTIIGTTVIVTSMSSLSLADKSQFAIEILNIQDSMDNYMNEHDTYPVNEQVTYNMSEVPSNSTYQFDGEEVTQNTTTFMKIDMQTLGIDGNKFGNNKKENDIYVVSETTGRVYYLKGVEYKSKLYYTVDDDLYVDLNIPNKINTTRSIKRLDVVFEVSNVNYTNLPVTVKVKIPKSATFNSVATTNSKSVSESSEENNYNIKSVNLTSISRGGNYRITVNYTYNSVIKEVYYDVTNFDSTKPNISVTTTENGINTDIGIVAGDAESGIKYIKYDLKDITDPTYFSKYGKNPINNKFTIMKDGAYTIYVEDKAGNIAMKTVTGYTNVPASWYDSVAAVYEGVPIPKGFALSGAEGEHSKATGVVIYEGDTKVDDTNVATAKKTRNQYVWVPVDNIERFVRRTYMGKSIALTPGATNQYWELKIDSNGFPVVNQNTTYVSYSLEATAMYESVNKYGGFYIARYEMGVAAPRNSSSPIVMGSTNVFSMQDKYVYNYLPWSSSTSMNVDTGGLVEVSRSVYPNNSENPTGVISTLIYGVQWDATLYWMTDIDNPNVTDGKYITNSTNMGNYCDTAIPLSELSSGARYTPYSAFGTYYTPTTGKAAGTAKTNKWLLTTGATDKTKVNNIYDMAGNSYEVTMEGFSTDSRSRRGSYFYDAASQRPASYRGTLIPTSSNGLNCGRIALYIK